MAVTIGNKTYRNIQEQVQKNKEDLEALEAAGASAEAFAQIQQNKEDIADLNLLDVEVLDLNDDAEVPDDGTYNYPHAVRLTKDGSLLGTQKTLPNPLLVVELTGESGTLGTGDLTCLQGYEDNVYCINCDNEIYTLNNIDENNNTMIYTNSCYDSNNDFWMKCITVDTSTRAWNLSKKKLSSGGGGTDPVSVRAATRPSTWPQIPISSEILDDRVYLLFDATGAYCLPQFKLSFTGAVECKMHLYKNTTLFRTDTVVLASLSFNTTQYAASADYNYVLVEISGGTITKLEIASGTYSRYDNISGDSSAQSQLLEISGKLDNLTECKVNKSGILRYFGLKKSNGTYTCSLENSYSLIAVLDLSVTSMAGMFNNCFGLTTIPQLDTSSVTSMGNTFNNCFGLTTIPQLDTSSVTNMNNMFYGSSLTTIPQLDTSSVTSMSSMFYNCNRLTTIPQLDTSNVTNMAGMFRYCNVLTTIPQLDTSSVTSMNNMFNGCYGLTTIPQLNTSNVTNMAYMFYSCSSLTTIPQLDTSSVTSMAYMFVNCASLVSINGTVIRTSTSLSSCKWMPHDELVEIIGNLPDLTGGTAQTLTLGATLLARLSADEKAVATNKNWTLA